MDDMSAYRYQSVRMLSSEYRVGLYLPERYVWVCVHQRDARESFAAKNDRPVCRMTDELGVVEPCSRDSASKIQTRQGWIQSLLYNRAADPVCSGLHTSVYDQSLT